VWPDADPGYILQYHERATRTSQERSERPRRHRRQGAADSAQSPETVRPGPAGPHEEEPLRRGQRGGRRLAGPEAENLVPRKQPGPADEGAQAAGQRQRGPPLRTAQAGEAAQGDDGAREGARDGAEGGERGRDARSQKVGTERTDGRRRCLDVAMSLSFPDTNSKSIGSKRRSDRRISPGAVPPPPSRNLFGLVSFMYPLVAAVLSVLELIWRIRRRPWRWRGSESRSS
jgi:hypothetical protein